MYTEPVKVLKLMCIAGHIHTSYHIYICISYITQIECKNTFQEDRACNYCHHYSLVSTKVLNSIILLGWAQRLITERAKTAKSTGTVVNSQVSSNLLCVRWGPPVCFCVWKCYHVLVHLESSLVLIIWLIDWCKSLFRCVSHTHTHKINTTSTNLGL